MAKYEMYTMQKEVQPLRRYLVAVVMIGGPAIAVEPLVREVIKRIAEEGWSAVDIRQFILYITTGILIVNWIWSCWYELDSLVKWLDPGSYTPPSAYLEAAISIVFAGFLVLLFYLVKYVEWYVGVFTLYALVDLYAGGIHELSEIGYALSSSEKKLRSSMSSTAKKTNYEEAIEKALIALRLYWAKNLETPQRVEGFLNDYKLEKWHHWFRNPYFCRLFIIFLTSLIVFTASLVNRGSYTGENISYWGIILIILVSEFVIARWRLRRDRELRKADELLKKVDSDNGKI
jgi:hypothetical protein